MELSELDGRIRGGALRRAAEAMDCVLVYAVPDDIAGLIPTWVATRLRTSLATCVPKSRIGQNGMAPDEVAVRFHHRLVMIHPVRMATAGDPVARWVRRPGFYGRP